MIGDDGAYDCLCNDFIANKIGGYAQIILLNPLHTAFPRMTLLLQSTCNSSDDVFEL